MYVRNQKIPEREPRCQEIQGVRLSVCPSVCLYSLLLWPQANLEFVILLPQPPPSAGTAGVNYHLQLQSKELGQCAVGLRVF